MPYRVTTAPALEPVTLAELKAFLRISDTTEDTLLASLGVVARQHIEGLTRCPMVTQTIAATWGEWPTDGVFVLPVGNLLTVSSLKYWPEPASTEVTVSAANYTVITKEQPGKVCLVETFSAPDIFDRPEAITLTITAGFGPAAVDVPETLKLAIKALAAYWFEQRLPIGPSSLGKLPMHVESLMTRHRVIAPEL